MSCGTSRDNPSWDVPLSLCPRTKICPCPVVPLSRDKGRRKNPGTNSSVLGRPNNFPHKNQKTGKGHSKTAKGCSKREKDVINRKGSSKTGKVCSKTAIVPPRPVSSYPVARFWARPVVLLSLCPKKLHCPFPLETLVHTLHSASMDLTLCE